MRGVVTGLVALALGACSYHAPATPTGDDDQPLPDGSLPGDGTPPTTDGAPATIVPLHVPDAPVGTGDLTLTETIDTTDLTIGGSSSFPAGVTFDTMTQTAGGTVAVLHVRGLRVPTNVRVTGSRPLVVVAGGDIEIVGVLDGAARRNTAGPGGADPGMGDGAGHAGMHVSTFRDAGGSGAGFATIGGTGGAATGCNPTAPTTTAGTDYGDAQLTKLVGGSGGGAAFASSCGTRPPGAGGGAIQLSSATHIRITGGITVGGGGGGGGKAQATGSPQCDDSAGAGGGSGGAIVLQSPLVDVDGTIAANGGGGGSSGGDPNGDDSPPEADGVDGQDGQLGSTRATGGIDVGVWSAAGGAGGAIASVVNGSPNPDCDGNGGGGGGSAGRIVIATPSTGATTQSGTVSPQSTQLAY